MRLTDQVAASTVEELTEKASKPVKGDGIYPASLIDGKTDETVRVDNAADLYRYMDRGYVLQSGIDHSMASNITSGVGCADCVQESVTPAAEN